MTNGLRALIVLALGLLLSGCPATDTPQEPKRWQTHIVPYTHNGKPCLVTLAWDNHPTGITCDWQQPEGQ